MTAIEQGTVSYSTENNIGTVEFFHPKSNSLPASLLNNLASAIEQAGKDTDTSVVVLKSGGKGAFCAGASFDELCSITNEDQGKKFFMGFANVINAMRTCPKLIVCRVHGKAVGGGIGIIAASDFSIACKGASVRLSEISLGIGPFVVGPAVGRKIGVSAFSTLALDATSWYDSEWALSNGLYNKEVTHIDELDKEVERISQNLASSNPEAMRNLKEIFWQSTGHWSATLEQRAEISGRLSLSSYTRDFIEKLQKEE